MLTFETRPSSIPLGFVPPLRTGETLDGHLDVMAGLYRLRRSELTSHLASAWSLADVDPTVEITDTQVGQRLLLELKRNAANGDQDGCRRQASMLPPFRGAYCPLCFADRAHRGELPCFQMSWLDSWKTHCERHLTPLFNWPWIEQHTGHRQIPAWMTWSYWNARFAHVSLRPNQKDAEASDYFGLHLFYAREVRRLMHGGDARALVWTHVLRVERSLFGSIEPLDALIWSLGGRSVRRTVLSDLVNFLLGTFERDWSDSPISSHLQYLGPAWMFRRPPTRAIDSYSARSVLRTVADPAQRRSVILIIGRIIESFVADFTCDSVQGFPMGAGSTGLTLALRRDTSEARLRWISERSVRWPVLIRQGLLETFEPEAKLAPAYARRRKTLRVAQQPR